GPVIGYAVTCVYGMPDPNYPNRLTYQDVIEALDAGPKPTILVIQQKWPPEIFNKAGLAGEIMTTSAQAVGCIGLLSNGPSRDVDAIRRSEEHTSELQSLAYLVCRLLLEKKKKKKKKIN